MTIHEFGQVHDEVVVLVHPSVVMWDYFEYVIPLMQEHYHLIVPALPGYDTESGSDFTSVEQIAKVLKHMSPRTIWRTFESCNNYDMPNPVTVDCEHIEYWYAKTEEKDRKGDIAYIRQNLPQTVFKVFEDIGHGGLAALKPELLVAEFTRVMGRND